MYICNMAIDNSFKLGDKVKLINDTLSGVIIEIVKNKVILRCSEGFDYSCDKSELIKYGHFDGHFINDNIIEFKDEKYSDKTKKKKVRINKNHTIEKKIKNNTSPLEIDLHIHQLVISEKGMSNFDMLKLQLKTAKKKLEYAIKNKKQKIVFIHGIGEGVLKTELHHLLKKYPVEYYEASYKKYGQGATEVYIYQNG